MSDLRFKALVRSLVTNHVCNDFKGEIVLTC